MPSINGSGHFRRLPTFALSLLVLVLAACGRATGTTPSATSTGLAQAQPTTRLLASPLPTVWAGEQQGGPAWTVDVVQNRQVLAAENGSVRLARAPFTLRVTLPQPLPVKLNANADDANFIALQPGFVFSDDCFEALCTGMDVAEERLNPTQELFVDPQSTHYLYYAGPDDHRWSRAAVSEANAVFERDVAVLNALPIEQFGANELYLVLFVDSANPGTIDPGEIQKLILLLQ